jgi:adenosylcobinamide-GDP ribazoletransferase
VPELVHALRFLTRLPIPFARTLDMPPLHQSMRMFPLAGALIGAFTALLLLLGDLAQIPPLLAGVLAAALGLLLTGALHEDGLADTADGLGGGKSRERRLEIMRDSRIGSYGTLALIVATAARSICYADLMVLPPLALLAVLASCEAFSRAMMVDLLWATPPARRDGLSVHAGQPSRGVTIFAVGTGILITLGAGSLTTFENAILALGLGLAATAGMRWFAMRLIGGQTGDICGAAQVLCSIMMLTAYTVTFH